jgi:hypothetical protein
MTDSLAAGMEALRAGDCQQAAELLGQAAGDHPDDVNAHMALGAALGGLQRWGEAIGALRQATLLAPSMPAAHFNLGRALEAAGRTEEARQAYREAVRIEPTHEKAAASLRRLVNIPVLDEVAWPTIGGPAEAAPPAVRPGAPVTAAPAARPYSPLGPAGSGIPQNVAAPPPPQVRPEIQPVAAPPPEPVAPAEVERPGPAQLLGEPEAKLAPPPRPPPPRVVNSRLPTFSAVMLWLVVLAILGALGYGIYRRVSSGYLREDAVASAEREVRKAYESIKLGLETPDAHYLVDYVPNRHNRPINEVDVADKNSALRKRKIHCNIELHKLTPKMEETGWPPVREVSVSLTVTWSDTSDHRETRKGTQVWRLKNGRWTPADWKVFGSAPLAFERWAGDSGTTD